MYIDHAFYQKNNIPPPSELFERMGDTLYFAKNTAGTFTAANSRFLQHFDLGEVTDINQHSDATIMPEHVANRIRNDDILLMAEKSEIHNQLELVPNPKGNISWFVTTKVCLRNKNGNVIGLEGSIRDLHLSAGEIQPLNEFNGCIEYIQQHLLEPFSIPELARMLNMSVSQFERKFKAHFQDTPLRFIKRLKIDHACRALAEGRSIATVASELGFTDQSYFTKEFKRATGNTPRQYAKCRTTLNKDTSLNTAASVGYHAS